MIQTQQSSSRNVVLGVQYLRFIAALLVVLTHGWQLAPRCGRGDIGTQFEIGAAGVDIFFTISGFIMVVNAAQRHPTALAFFWTRLRRVAPAYWVATFAMAAILLAAPSVFSSAQWDLGTFLASLAFIAWPHPTQPVAQPLLQIGWTLNYEMAFYAIFALGLYFAPKRIFEFSAAIIGALVLIGLFAPTGNPIVNFYTSPLMLEFVFGMAVGKLYLSGWILRQRFAGGLLLAAIIAFAAVSTFYIPTSDRDPSRVLYWGVPSAFLLWAIVSLEDVFAAVEVKLLHTLGDASYSIYLSHLFAIGAIRFCWGRWHLAEKCSDVFLLSTVVMVCIGVGLCYWSLVEKPLTRWVQRARLPDLWHNLRAVPAER